MNVCMITVCSSFDGGPRLSVNCLLSLSSSNCSNAGASADGSAWGRSACSVYVCVAVHVSVCVRACMRACVRAGGTAWARGVHAYRLATRCGRRGARREQYGGLRTQQRWCSLAYLLRRPLINATYTRVSSSGRVKGATGRAGGAGTCAAEQCCAASNVSERSLRGWRCAGERCTAQAMECL